MGAALQKKFMNLRRGGGFAPPVFPIPQRMGGVEPRPYGEQEVRRVGVLRIATPACAPVRNDRFLEVRRMWGGSPRQSADWFAMTFFWGCSMGKRKLAQVGQEAVERLDLPPEVAAGVPQMELYGNRQIYLSGHRGVISYSTEEVAVAGGSLTVHITGTELQLAAMTAGELRLTGFIKQVELME